jgi:acetylornithine deacetylase
MIDPIPLLERLITINSVNSSLVPGAPGETGMVTFLESWCRQQGLEVTSRERSGRPSLIITAKGSGGGRTLLLNAHTDTVGVEGMTDPFQPRRVGNRLYGRGAADMKGSVAACLVAIAHAKTRNLAGDVIFTAVADEENASIGTAQVMEEVRADAAIVTEPTQLQLHIAHRGFAVFEVKVEGKASHTSLPHMGINAITHMGMLLHEIQERQAELFTLPRHPLLGHGLLQGTLLQGGQELFTTPASATLHLERRTVPGETKESIAQELSALFERVTKKEPQFRGSFRNINHRDPFEVNPDAEIVELLRGLLQMRGIDPRLEGAPYWMDSGIIATYGIPTVVFGPKGDGFHTPDEWVDIDSVRVCADVLFEAAVSFCGGE